MDVYQHLCTVLNCGGIFANAVAIQFLCEICSTGGQAALLRICSVVRSNCHDVRTRLEDLQTLLDHDIDGVNCNH